MKTIALYLHIFLARNLAVFAEWFASGWQRVGTELLDWIHAIQQAAWPTKVMLYASMIAGATFIQAILKDINFQDWAFVRAIFILAVIDTILALAYHIQKGSVSSKGWGKAGIKLLVYMLLIAATHFVTNTMIDGAKNPITEWINNVVYSFMLVREFISILEKAGMLGVVVPAWILARLNGFTQEGKMEVSETDNQPKV